MFCPHTPSPFDRTRARSQRASGLARRTVPRLVAFAIAASLLSSASAAQSLPSTRDRFARIIARSDAIVLGRVLEAGVREVPTGEPSAGVLTAQGFARIAVQRWILGPDADATLDVRLPAYDASVELLRKEAAQPGRSVILYLLRSRGEWWAVSDFAGGPENPAAGIEVHPDAEALKRVTSIRQEAQTTSPDALAARADLAVVCTLDRFTESPPGMICRIERVVFGTLSASELKVVTSTPRDLHRGRALLLLARRPDSTWEVLDDGASCYYFHRDRLARSSAPVEAVLTQVSTAHARRQGGTER